jgi:enoyl-CoA hydratase
MADGYAELAGEQSMTHRNVQRFDNVEYHVENDVAVVAMSHPPVNGLGLGVRRGLVAAFEVARCDPQVRAIVLKGSGRGFSAGGDIREFGTSAAASIPALSLHVHPVIEASEKPVVAAIHGFAIGGGLETALVCHYRLVANNAQIGLPECKLGVIPLSGTQRLPRVLGFARSIEFILGAQIVAASTFAETALFDRIVEGDEQRVLRLAIELAREKIGSAALPLIRRLPLPDHDPVSVVARASMPSLPPPSRLISRRAWPRRVRFTIDSLRPKGYRSSEIVSSSRARTTSRDRRQLNGRYVESCLRKSPFLTFPDGVRGSSATMQRRSGVFCFAMPAAAKWD